MTTDTNLPVEASAHRVLSRDISDNHNVDFGYKHADDAASAYSAYVADRTLFKAAMSAVMLVRSYEFEILEVLGQSRDQLISLWGEERFWKQDSPLAEALWREMKKRDLFYVWLGWDIEDMSYDRWLLEGLSHWCRESSKRLRVHKAILDEATYSVWTSKTVLDLKTSNVNLAAMESVVAMKRLASINITSTELLTAMKDPSTPNPRIQGVTTLHNRQLLYRKILEQLDRHLLTTHEITVLVRASTATLMDLALLERGLLGYLQVRSITAPFTRYLIAASKNRMDANRDVPDIFPKGSSDPRLRNIEKWFKYIMRAVYDEMRPIFGKFEFMLLSKSKEIEASGALLPYAAKIRRSALLHIKTMHLSFYNRTLQTLGPSGYKPSIRYKRLCQRALAKSRHELRQTRGTARRKRSMAIDASPHRSLEEGAARRKELRARRDSVTRKIISSQHELVIGKLISKISSGKVLPKNTKRAMRGMVIKKMVVSRTDLVLRKIASYQKSKLIRKYWHIKNLVRYVPVQARPDLRSARKESSRRRWAPFFELYGSTQNDLPDEKQCELAKVAAHIPERTQRRQRIRRVLNTPLFSLTKQRRRRNVRALLRQFPPIVDAKRAQPTLSLPNTDTTLGRVCGILGFEEATPVGGDVSGRNMHNQPGGRSGQGRIWLSPSPRMRAPHPTGCFSAPQTIHCASGHSHSSADPDNSSTNFSGSSGNPSPGPTNSHMNSSGREQQDSNDMNQDPDYRSEGEQENDSSSGSNAESDAESEIDDEQEVHVPLSFQIPADTLREAMQASPNSQAGFYSHRLYRGPENQFLSVHYCCNMETAEKVAQYFLDEKVLGFDIEWKPWASPTSIKDNASLIQIASEDRIALFHISLFSGDSPDELVPPSLKVILMSPNIWKVGVAIKGDFTRLETHLGIRARGVFEISRLHNLVEYYASDPSKITKKLVALATQTKLHLQLPLFKGDVRESDWSKPLNGDQIRYAATDAYAGLRIFDVLESKRKMLRPTPPLPPFCDSDDKSRQTSRRAKNDLKSAAKTKEEEARSAAEGGQEEEAEEHETAPEDLMDSHELEAASESESASQISEKSDDPNANHIPQSKRASQAKTRRVGRVDFSKLTGPDPGYPKLPQTQSENEDDSDSSDAFDPPKTRLGGRIVKDAPPREVLQEVENEVGMNEFEDKDLEEVLLSMQIDDVSEPRDKFPSTGAPHTEDEQPPHPTSRDPVFEDEDGERCVASPSTSLTSTAKDKKKRKLKSIAGSTDPPLPLADTASQLQFKPLAPDTTPKSTEYIMAETWAQAYLFRTIPSAVSSSTPLSHIRATVPHLRAYHLWHHQRLPLDVVAGHLRDPPLALSTVVSYIAQAVDLERLEYRNEDLKEALLILPLGLRRGRYGRLVERVNGR